MKRYLIASLLFTLLAVAIYFTLSAVKKPQELRGKAAVPPEQGSATVTLSPSNPTVIVGQKATLAMSANIQSGKADGFQVIAYFAGVVPADLKFTPATIATMTVVKSTIEDVPQTTGDPSAPQSKLTLAYLTDNPESQFSGTGLPVPLGTFSMTPTQAGTMSITFDNTLSKITRADKAAPLPAEQVKDVLIFPENGTIAFATPTPTSTPTPTATPTPTNTPTPTFTPTPTPTPILPDFRINNVTKSTDGKSLTIEVCNDSKKGTDKQFSVALENPATAETRSFMTQIFGAPGCGKPALLCNGLGTICHGPTLIATADSTNVIAESNENNNSLTVAMPTPTPTNTPTPTFTPTPTPTNTPTPTPTNTPTPSFTPSPTPTNSPTPTPVSCRREDINRNGFVNMDDYQLLIDNFFFTNPQEPRADINHDGIVDLTDYSMLVLAYDPDHGTPSCQ